jgi:transcriptional regulator with XRE-family HTH domain
MRGATLRQARRRLGWSQERLAKEIGVRRNTVARWERDELGMRPTTERLIRLLLADALTRSKRRS